MSVDLQTPFDASVVMVTVVRAMTRFAGGTSGDRQVLEKLRSRPWGTNDGHTVFYRKRLAGLQPYLFWRFKCAGVDLARHMRADAVRGDAAWHECAEHDRRTGFAAAAHASVNRVTERAGV